jgi:FKBP-type peptidyl-prolyl cis-trans isomerase
VTPRSLLGTPLRWSFAIGFGLAGGCADPPPTPLEAEAKDAKDDEQAKAAGPITPKRESKLPKRKVTEVPAPQDVAAAPADAEATERGVKCKQLSPGTGDVPGPNDTVKIHFTAWTAAGETVDTTSGRKAPKLVRMSKPPIEGWADAIGMMAPGEKRRCWIPQEFAYKGRPGAPEGTITYEIELVEIMRAPETPPDVAAPPGGATKTKSGLAYSVLTKGTGDKKPRSWDRVRLHYSGWTTDGKMFDSSLTRGRPSSFTLDKVPAGWAEGLQLMTTGAKWRLWIPEELAYKGQPGKPQGLLVFEIELLEIDELPEPPPPPQVPPDVAAAPSDAKKTASGLAYKVLTEGSGKDKPKETSTVSVHYAGWTTDGKMFDSSITRGRPSTFPLNRVIAGWTEGVQLMAVGDKWRFWIPEELAYKGKPGRPQGMLVFDIELLEIK